MAACGADAVTLNPYLGLDAIQPFLDREHSFVYALCRTSNPTARELQGQIVAADLRAGWPVEPLYLRVARLATQWAGPERIGLVVGATAPSELGEIRALVAQTAFLVPGIGVQGGDIDAVLAAGPVAGRAGRGMARSAACSSTSDGPSAESQNLRPEPPDNPRITIGEPTPASESRPMHAAGQPDCLCYRRPGAGGSRAMDAIQRPPP